MNNNVPNSNKLFEMLSAASGGKISRTAAQKAQNGDISDLVASLDSESRQKLEHALSDSEQARKILNSDAARQMLSKLFGDKNG